MTAVPVCCIADLIDDASNTVNSDQSERREGEQEECKRQGNHEAENVFNEVIDTPISAIVASSISFFAQNDCWSSVSLVSGELIEEHVGTEVLCLGTVHDCFLEAHRVKIHPHHDKLEDDDRGHEPLKPVCLCDVDSAIVLRCVSI